MSNFISLDLEMNQSSNKIIEIGAVIGNIETGEIIETFQRYIRIDEPLNPFIIKLTGITEEQVQNGISLKEAYEDLVKIHTKYNCHRNPMTWGGGDSQELRIQLGMDQKGFLFGRRWIDVKTIYILYCLANGMKERAGLSKAVSRLGLQFIGNKHSGLWDSYNAFIVAHKLISLLKQST